MKKSGALNLRNWAGLCSDSSGNGSDDDYSDSDSGSCRHQTIVNKSVQEQFASFQVQDFGKSEVTGLPPFKNSDFEVGALNTPFLPSRDPPSVPVECAFLMCSSSVHFPRSDCEYLRNRPTIFMWRDCTSILNSEFVNHVQTYFKDHYTLFRPRMRFLYQIDPTLDKLNTLSMLRRDVPTGRILYHYIGYGSPNLDDMTIPCLDKKTGTFVNFSMKTLFESVRPPSFFLFDCDTAATALVSLKQAAALKQDEKRDVTGMKEQFVTRQVDWSDWFCIGATDVGESLPSDPHLPKDFLTSCIFTPVRLGVICHMLQFYRTTIVNDQFPIDKSNEDLFNEDSEVCQQLLKVLNAIVDAIAAEGLPEELHRALFRKDPVISVLFQRFLLAQYLLRPYQIHPVSQPALPDLSTHPLWQHWRTTVDITVAYFFRPPCDLSTDLFQMAKRSFKVFLNRNEENFVAKHIVLLLFHVRDSDKLHPKVVRLLARFASRGANPRKMLAETVVFPSVFALLLKNVGNSTFHSLCYLVVTLLHECPKFVYEIGKDQDLQQFVQLIWDNKLPEETRSFVTAIAATLVSVNEQVRMSVVPKAFLSHVSALLGKSTSLLSLWLLLLLRRMFDSYDTDWVAMYDLGLFAQVSSFVVHTAPEVRAAALSVMSCLLQVGENLANAQLAIFALGCVFDASYIVRYNCVLFLGRFLSIHSDEQVELDPNFASDCQQFSAFYSQWFGQAVSYSDVLDVTALIKIADTLLKQPSILAQMVKIVRSAVNILKDDPHPDISSSGHQLQTEALPKRTSSNEPLTGPVCCLSESGGDALYKMCMRQLVNSGKWEYTGLPRKPSGVLDALPQPVLCHVPSTRISHTTRFKIEGSRITHVAYHSTSLSMAIAAGGRQVYFDNEKHVKTTLTMKSDISTLNIVDWLYYPILMAGCADGCLHIWEPNEPTPRLCFRADWPDDLHADLMAAPFRAKPQVVTSRGSSGTIRLWDIEAQRLVGEWASGATERVTALRVHAQSSDMCVAGFVNGLILTFDLRCSHANGPEVISVPKPREEVFKIVDGLSSTSVSFMACTRQGSCVQWEDLEQPSFIQIEEMMLSDFDAHSYSPLLTFAPQASIPIITDLDGHIIHRLKAVGPNACCSFHSVLPVVAFGTTNGDLIEYQLT